MLTALKFLRQVHALFVIKSNYFTKQREIERRRERRKDWGGGGRCSYRHYTYYYKGESEKFTSLKVSRQCPLVLLVKVG
jgi:hypothetical protein